MFANSGMDEKNFCRLTRRFTAALVTCGLRVDSGQPTHRHDSTRPETVVRAQARAPRPDPSHGTPVTASRRPNRRLSPTCAPMSAAVTRPNAISSSLAGRRPSSMIGCPSAAHCFEAEYRDRFVADSRLAACEQGQRCHVGVGIEPGDHAVGKRLGTVVTDRGVVVGAVPKRLMHETIEA